MAESIGPPVLSQSSRTVVRFSLTGMFGNELGTSGDDWPRLSG